MFESLSFRRLRRSRKSRPVIGQPPAREVGARWTEPLQPPEEWVGSDGLWNRSTIVRLLLTIVLGISVGVPLGVYLHWVL